MNDLVKIEATDELIAAITRAIWALNYVSNTYRISLTRSQAVQRGNDTAANELRLLVAGLQTNRAYHRSRAARGITQAS